MKRCWSLEEPPGRREMSNLSLLQCPEYKPVYLQLLERERDSLDSLLVLLRETQFRPRRMVVEQKKVTLPFGVSFSRTRIVLDE
jgi:hypothetical protein